MSGLLSHLVRRTLTPETAVRPLAPRRFVGSPGEALPALEADRPAREVKFEQADETLSMPGRRTTLPQAEPPSRPTADRQNAAGPARPQRLAGPVRSPTVAIEAVEESGPVVRVAPARKRPDAPAAAPRFERARRRRRPTAEADEVAVPGPADPPTGAETARPSDEALRGEAPPARTPVRPPPVVRVTPPVEAPAASAKRRAMATTAAEPESRSASSLPTAAPAPAPPPARAGPAAPRPALARSPPLGRPDAHRPSPLAGRAAKPTPPDVHITIGRIEIRAVAAPAAPEPRAKTAPRPVESLADYLARRDGQRR